jgi:hypothetical protein
MLRAHNDDDDDDEDESCLHQLYCSNSSGSNSSNNKSLSACMCELDVIEWKDSVRPHPNRIRQNRRRQLGERLVRKRAFAVGLDDYDDRQESRGGTSDGGNRSDGTLTTITTNNTYNNNNNNRTTRKQPNVELVYRKRESFSNPAYTNCSFLDSYDRVVAIDCNGSMDIFRLDDLRNRTNTTKKSPGTQRVVTELELGSMVPVNEYSTAHMQPLANGSIVAMGLMDDGLLLLDLDRSSVLSMVQDLTPVSLARTTTNNPTHFRAWRSQSPRRKYYRDRHNPHLTVLQLAKNQLGGMNSTDTSELQTICSNSSSSQRSSPLGRIPNHIRFVPHLRPPDNARWDVYEAHCGSASSVLLVAHVDGDYDVFWTQILDRRVVQGRQGNAKRRPVIVVDASSQDLPGKKEEHVTACTFLSDVCVATAHISCPNYGLTPAREFFDRDLPYSGHGMETCVKLWDLRMLSSSTDSRSTRPAHIISTPIFPEADAAVMDPAESIQTKLTRKGTLSLSKSVADNKQDLSSSGGSDFVITNLSGLGGDGGRGGNNGSTNMGSLLVTVQSRTRSTKIEHHRLDLGTRRVTRKICQSNQNLGCHPIYAVAKSHEFMVCCTKGGGNSRGASSTACTRLGIYNLNEKPESSLSSSSRGRKRLIEGHTLDPSTVSVPSYAHPHQATAKDDPSWSFLLQPNLVDRYGVETDLCCVAMNANGTSILGGSIDGDLFVWRGI